MSDLVHYMSNDATNVATSIKDKVDEMNGYKELFHETEKKLFGDAYQQLNVLLETKTTWKEDRENFYLQKYIKQDTSKETRPGKLNEIYFKLLFFNCIFI